VLALGPARCGCCPAPEGSLKGRTASAEGWRRATHGRGQRRSCQQPSPRPSPHRRGQRNLAGEHLLCLIVWHVDMSKLVTFGRTRSRCSCRLRLGRRPNSVAKTPHAVGRLIARRSSTAGGRNRRCTWRPGHRCGPCSCFAGAAVATGAAGPGGRSRDDAARTAVSPLATPLWRRSREIVDGAWPRSSAIRRLLRPACRKPVISIRSSYDRYRALISPHGQPVQRQARNLSPGRARRPCNRGANFLR
jgi:hypothetical protein